MLIDTTAATPPAVCWFIDRARVRRGLGPVRLAPTHWVRANGVPWALEARGTTYPVSGCYTTEQHARDQAGRIARAEILLERSRAAAIMTKLEQAQRIARGQPTDDQFAAALGPCGK